MATRSGIKLMLCSANEVAAMLRKAAVGSGLPIGLAVDAAAAAVWLEGHGVAGFAAVMASLDRPSAVPGDDRRSFLFDGPSLIDRLVAVGDKEVVRVPSIPNPRLLLGYLGRAAEDYGLITTVQFGNGATALVSPGELLLRGELDPEDSVTLGVSLTDRSAVVPAPAVRAIAVSDVLWADAADRAALTYVPATDESRLNGAGAGLTDND